MGKNLVLIDGHALAFRMFFALERTSMQTTEHVPTWAVFGFFKTIFDMLKGKMSKNKPDCIAVAFDVSKQTFRLEKYPEYKANRLTMPDDLRPQLELIMEGLKALNIPIYTKEGFEGDDLIGTLATRAKALGHKTYILTGDKDSFQLIDDEGYIKVLIPSKGEIIEYDKEKVYEKLGVYPSQVIDYKALSGDTSDNIPGIKGIGPKTAQSLLNEYQTLDGIYENLDKITKKALLEKLTTGKEIAYLSQYLATIKKDVEIDFNFEHTKLEIPDKNKVIEYFNSVQFFSFARNINIILAPFQTCDCANVFQETKSEEKAGTNKQEQADEAPKQLGFFDLNPDFEPFQGEIDDKKFEEYQNNANIKMDLELASYIKDSSRKHDFISQIQDCLGTLLSNKTTDEDFVNYARKLEEFYSKNLSEKEKKLLFEIEMPLRKVLKKMEAVGIYLNTKFLNEFGLELNAKIKKIEDEVFSEVGETFNLNSPKQVAEVLFKKLEIKPKKKNKTGFSTSAKVLEELAQEYEIARKILDHRALMKLKTTYVDVLPRLVDDASRVHTHYNQALTTTGRLSSSDPNLQNIPIRTALGAKIRTAFAAPDDDYLILSADYSQIELRLLAHISEDEALISAFKSGEDIHTLTASKIFGVAKNEVTDEMRRRAKAVNFGIIYGQTRFGLASSLKITPFEAQNFIDRYFATYPKIRTYMNNTLFQAHDTGYVETIFGRKRYLGKELNSRNGNIREFAERAAINAPIQGSAADLIKLAMINLDKKLEGKKTKIVLQVHDELVLEVHKSEFDEVLSLVKECMEGVYPLHLPLVVDVEYGRSWKDE